MYTDYFAELLRAFSPLASRRALLARLTGGLLATGSLAFAFDEVGAKKNGRRKKQRNRKQRARRKKRKNQNQNPSPPTPPSGPVTRADATCSVSAATAFVALPNQRLAQTFTALTNGPLVRAELSLSKDPGSFGDYILHLGTVDAFGVPTNAVLAATEVANSRVPDGSSTLTFSFANPATVAAGTQYALVLTRTEPGQLLWRGNDGDPCAGRVFKSPDRTAPFEPFDPFGTVPDFIYTTFVSA